MIAVAVISFLAGIGIGCFVMLLATNPQRQAQAKLAYDLKHRLGKDGKPLNLLNDYERHLYALSLKKRGYPREKVAQALFDLGLDDVPAPRREKYVKMVLESMIVGFGEELLPAYEEV